MGNRHLANDKAASQEAATARRALHPTVPAYETDMDRNAREAERTGVHPGILREFGNRNNERR